MRRENDGTDFFSAFLNSSDSSVLLKGVVVLFIISFLLILSVLFSSFKNLFSSNKSDEYIYNLKNKMSKYLESEVKNCEENKFVSEKEISRKFSSYPYEAITKALKIIENDDENFEYDHYGERIRARTAEYSMKCLAVRYVRGHFKVFFIIGVVVTSIIAAIAYLIYETRKKKRINELSSRIILSILAQPNTSVSPIAVRKQIPNISNREWAETAKTIERNPVICVYRKKEGKIWEISKN